MRESDLHVLEPFAELCVRVQPHVGSDSIADWHSDADADAEVPDCRCSLGSVR